MRPDHGYTLLDPSLLLPPLHLMAPELVALPPAAAASPPARGPLGGDAPIDWELDYHRARLGQLSGAALRNDPSTGFSRQLDSDVLTLGMAWHLAGSRVGLAYQFLSARGGQGEDAGLARFLPGSAATTHALTLGVTREFGGSAPPPAPPPLLVAPAPTATP